jgi:hypothetical protein
MDVLLFFGRMFISLLVCSIIIDLLYVCAYAMLGFIKDMLPNILFFYSSAIGCGIFSSIPGWLWILRCYSWYQSLG